MLRWEFGLPGTTGSKGRPSIVNGRVYVGSESGAVYTLDAKTGCTAWMFETLAGVRAAITVGKPDGLSPPAVFFGDARAFVYAVNVATAVEIWKVKVEAFRSTLVTGSPRLHGWMTGSGLPQNDPRFFKSSHCRFLTWLCFHSPGSQILSLWRHRLSPVRFRSGADKSKFLAVSQTLISHTV